MSEPIDYYSPLPKAMRRRPPLLSGFGVGLAAVGVVAICFDYSLRMDADVPSRVTTTEVVVGLAATIVCAAVLLRYHVSPGERTALILSILAGLLAAFVGTLMPRVIHN